MFILPRVKFMTRKSTRKNLNQASQVKKSSCSMILKCSDLTACILIALAFYQQVQFKYFYDDIVPITYELTKGVRCSYDNTLRTFLFQIPVDFIVDLGNEMKKLADILHSGEMKILRLRQTDTKYHRKVVRKIMKYTKFCEKDDCPVKLSMFLLTHESNYVKNIKSKYGRSFVFYGAEGVQRI